VSYRQIAVRSANALHLHPILAPVPSWCVGMLRSVAIPIGRLRRRTPPFAALLFDNRSQYYSSEKARRALGYGPRGFDEIIDEWVVWRNGQDGSGRIRGSRTVRQESNSGSCLPLTVYREMLDGLREPWQSPASD